MEKEEFLGILKTKKSAPFLFLGSGFTKHYLNTPKWDELLQHFLLSLLDNILQLWELKIYMLLLQP